MFTGEEDNKVWKYFYAFPPSGRRCTYVCSFSVWVISPWAPFIKLMLSGRLGIARHSGMGASFSCWGRQPLISTVTLEWTASKMELSADRRRRQSWDSRLERIYLHPRQYEQGEGVRSHISGRLWSPQGLGFYQSGVECFTDPQEFLLYTSMWLKKTLGLKNEQLKEIFCCS